MLSEEVEVLQETNKERSTLARQSKNKKNGINTSKTPFNDYTDKQIEKKHSDVHSYSMSEPVLWKEFRTWPEEYQREYIFSLRERFNVLDVMLADMWGLNHKYFGQFVKKIHANVGGTAKKCKPSENDKGRFALWCLSILDIPEKKEVKDDTPTPEMIKEAVAEAFAPIIDKAKKAAEPPEFVVSSGEWTFTGDLRSIIEGLPAIFQFRDDYTKTNYRVRIQFMKEEVPMNGQ